MQETSETTQKYIKTEVDNQVDDNSVVKYEQQIKIDRVRENWKKISVFLSQYKSPVNLDDISIKLIPGEMGNGTLSADSSHTLIIEIPNEMEAISSLQSGFNEAGIVLTDEEASSLLYKLLSQTTLHEGTHVLIDSKPGSQFALFLEEEGLENQSGYDSTLLDEGITYAVQNYFAPFSEKIGKLTVLSQSLEELKEEKDPQKKIVMKRKILGNLLTPLVKEYLDQEKSADDEFMQKAIERLKEIQVL